jgi:hypothetical protein
LTAPPRLAKTPFLACGRPPATGALTAVATAVTAFLLWLDRRERQRAGEPAVECEVRQDKESGWIVISLVVRNFKPYAVYVESLQIRRPRGCRIADEKIFRPFDNKAGRYILKLETATGESAPINVTLKPYGQNPGYLDAGSARFKVSEGDASSRTFWASSPKSGAVHLKMALIWELRTRVVRKHAIPINRTITLASAKSPGR